MRYRLLDLLVCPHCNGSLKLTLFSTAKNNYKIKTRKTFCRNRCYFENKKIRKGIKTSCSACFNTEIVDALLTCDCGRWYPVIDGIPRMLTDSLKDDSIALYHNDFISKYKTKIPKKLIKETKDSSKTISAKRKTLDSFSFQWNAFSLMQKEFRKNFLNYIKPIKSGFFKGKLVLDAGCGFGRHTYYSAEFGAETVGLDLSEAVKAAYDNTREFPHAHIVQGDLYNLPFRKAFDFIFSIGVIHHLPDPEGAFQYLVSQLKKGSSIFIWVYGREGRWFKANVVELIRYFTTRMPYRLLYYLCYIPAILYHFGLNVPYKILNRYDATKDIAKHIPGSFYAKFPFQVKHADSFDQLSVPLINYYRKEQLEVWFKKTDLKDIWITDIEGRSWRCFGTLRKKR